MPLRPRYLVRFDDLCPTMNWWVWAKIEAILVQHQIAPLLAVVPDNQDRKLMVGPANAHFWEEVRKWQARGWTIGLHGYQHTYVTDDAGMLGIQCRSEFAGLSAKEQERKLFRAAEIFRREDVAPQVWVAPAHSFDRNTVAALKKIGLLAISDGFALAPHVDPEGVFWVPQQLWRFRWRPVGVWTVCCHANFWSEAQVVRFLHAVEKYRHALTDFSFLASSYRHRQQGPMDSLYAKAHIAVRSLRTQLHAVL